MLGFCLPIVGLILYLIWKDTLPKNAKAAGIGALVATILVVFYVIVVGVIIGASSY